MRYEFRLETEDLHYACMALEKAALWEAENLKSVPAGGYRDYKALIDSHRNNVVNYMALRKKLMRYRERMETEEAARLTRKNENTGAEMVREVWNREIRRIKCK